MTKKKKVPLEPWFYVQKQKSIWAFKTSAERNFWVIHSNADPVSRQEIRRLLPVSQIRETWKAWPNKPEDREFLKDFYKSKLEELDETFIKVRRMRKLLGTLTDRNLKHSEVEARQRLDGGDVRLPRR